MEDNKPLEVTETEIQEEKHEEKLFTQEEVNKIVSNRLKQQEKRAESEEEKALQSRSNELDAREKKLSCREYLMDKGYPMEMLGIIDTSDVDSFKEKADKAVSITGATTQEVAPLAMLGEVYTPSNNFAPNVKHKPRRLDGSRVGDPFDY